LNYPPSYRPEEPDDLPAFGTPESNSAESDDDLLGEDGEDESAYSDSVTYRAAGSDPAFGYLVAIALSFGLLPFIPANTDLRYVLVWAVLAGFGVLAWLLGRTARIQQETPENLAWGVVFGLMIGTPLLAFGGSVLSTTAHLLFRVETNGVERLLTPGSVLALLIFVQPLAETLFFRGVFQEIRSFWLVGLLATLWSALLYFPLLNIGQYPGVDVVIGTALLMMNLIYSYVRRRNGLAAAWLCQITLNVILLFIPFVSR
jgi:hypothetical protein